MSDPRPGTGDAPTVTVGVPVYNQADLLRESLECLRTQTFTDFQVLIYDNASTDGTPAVAREFAARDPRFVYHRQPYNKGALRNFNDVLLAARGPYFLWRAADDYSDPRFLEVLHGLLAARPEKALAVGRVLNSHDRKIYGENPQPKLRGDGSLADRWTLYRHAHASWIYGFFRREPLAAAMAPIVAGYEDDPWAADYLTLLPFLLDGAVEVTDATWFAVGVRTAPRAPGAPRARAPEPDLDRMIALRRQFRALGRNFTDPRFPGPVGRLFSHVLLWHYANLRVFKFKRIARGVAARAVGLSHRR